MSEPTDGAKKKDDGDSPTKPDPDAVDNSLGLGKRRKDGLDDDGVEMMLTPNEEAAARLEVEKRDGEKSAKDVPMESIDDDAEPEMLTDQSGQGSLFPGAPCVTVAKRETGRKVSFVNRYGTRARGWFVLSPEFVPPKNGSLGPDDLQNIADRGQRYLDRHRSPTANKPKASHVTGAMNMVWEMGEHAGDPVAAAELLNPAKVKRADELTTMKQRREYVRSKSGNEPLDRYPIWYTEAKYDSTFMEFLTRERVENPKRANWELNSSYKAIKYKDSLEAERSTYKAARQAANRFLEWYKTAKPDGFQELTQSLERDPTVLRSTSPEARHSQPPQAKPIPKTATVQAGHSEPTSGKALTPDTANRIQEPTPPAEPDEAGGTDATEDDEKLSLEDFREAVFEAYVAKKEIDPNAITAKETARWKAFFKTKAQLEKYKAPYF